MFPTQTRGEIKDTPAKLAQALWSDRRHTPALELLDQKLVSIMLGQITRLIVSIGPQEGKSESISHYFPLWMLKTRPDWRIGIISYGQSIAERWGRVIRADIETHNGRHGNTDLGLSISRDHGAAGDWSLAEYSGGVYCTGIGGSLTGRKVDLLIIDDPFKDRIEASSETMRDKVWDWWQSVAIPRLAPGAPVVVVATRWHEDDLIGRLVVDAPDLWTVLNIPAEAEENDPLGRQPGEFLQSARNRTVEQWVEIKRAVGSTVWNALYQGRPSPDEGTIWQRPWWRFYSERPFTVRQDGTCIATNMDQVVASWDMAFKDAKGSDFVVGTVWGRRGPEAYLLDMVRDRLDFTATAAAVERLAFKWPQATATYIEDKANGPAVISHLRTRMSGLIAEGANDSKMARASAVAPFIEAGNVWLPQANLAPWVLNFVDEAAAFPNGAHDDMVDSASQALRRLLGRARKPSRVTHAGPARHLRSVS